MAAKYDAFISYSRSDSDAVKVLVQGLLRVQPLDLFLDVDEIPPGGQWLPILDQALTNSKSALIVFGPSGLGQYQSVELQVANQLQVESGLKVIPVILPGGAPTFKEHFFLAARHNAEEIKVNIADDQIYVRLVWGITGKKPAATVTPSEIGRTESKIDPIGEEVENFCSYAKTGNYTFFVGPSLDPSGRSEFQRKAFVSGRLLEEIHVLEDLGLKQNTDTKIAMPVLPVPVASSYYAMRRGDDTLQNLIVDLMMEQPEQAAGFYSVLAELLGMLSRRPPVRGRPRLSQLLVTTNCDLAIERSLLLSGLAFTRIIHHRNAIQATVYSYPEVSLLQGDQVQAVDPNGRKHVESRGDIDQMIMNWPHTTVTFNPSGSNSNPLETLSLSDYPGPILYKFFGSQDVANSCVISSEHIYEFAHTMVKHNCIPAEIIDVIANTRALFIGYPLLDHDFRLLYYALLRRPFEFASHSRTALLPTPAVPDEDIAQQIEMRLRGNIKESILKHLKIVTLDSSGEMFVSKILQTLPSLVNLK